MGAAGNRSDGFPAQRALKTRCFLFFKAHLSLAI